MPQITPGREKTGSLTRAPSGGRKARTALRGLASWEATESRHTPWPRDSSSRAMKFEAMLWEGDVEGSTPPPTPNDAWSLSVLLSWSSFGPAMVLLRLQTMNRQKLADDLKKGDVGN